MQARILKSGLMLPCGQPGGSSFLRLRSRSRRPFSTSAVVLRDAANPSTKPQIATGHICAVRYVPFCRHHPNMFHLVIFSQRELLEDAAWTVMSQRDADAADISLLQWSPTARGAQRDANEPSTRLQLTSAQMSKLGQKKRV